MSKTGKGIDCRCEGLGLVREMIQLYTDMAAKGKHSRATPGQQKHASELTDKILAKINKGDIYQEGHSLKLWESSLVKAKISNDSCKDGNLFDCTLGLEYVRTILHGDWGIRAAMLCDPKFEPGNATDDNKAVWWSQYLLRGWGTPEGALKLVEDRMKVHGCDLQ